MEIDGISLSPDSLSQDLLQLVVGERWPNGDEGAMRALAGVWSQAAAGLAQIQQDADAAARAVAQYSQGGAADAFQSFWSSGFDDGRTSRGNNGSPPALPFSVQFCNAMAQALNDGANQIETTKDTIIGNVAILAATVLPQIVAGFFDFGITDATAAGEIAGERVATQAFLDAAKEFIAHVVEEALEQAGLQLDLNFVIQAKEWAEGHTDGINVKELGGSWLQGLEGGGLGAGFGQGIGKLGGSRLGESFTGSMVGRTATGVVSGQLTNVTLDLINNHTVSTTDFTNGSASAVLGGFGHCDESEGGGILQSLLNLPRPGQRARDRRPRRHTRPERDRPAATVESRRVLRLPRAAGTEHQLPGVRPGHRQSPFDGAHR